MTNNLRTSSSRRISRPMFEKACKLMQGYKETEFEMWVSYQGIMYLTIFHITYNIDLDGNHIARRTSDGETL